MQLSYGESKELSKYDIISRSRLVVNVVKYRVKTYMRGLLSRCHWLNVSLVCSVYLITKLNTEVGDCTDDVITNFKCLFISCKK